MGDDDPTPEQLAAVERFLDAGARETEAVIAKLYGPLPSWFPQPALLHVRQAIDSLRDAEQSDEQILEVVKQERAGTLQVPGTARDSVGFYRSANYLAHVQWALEQSPERALTELAGADAAWAWQARRRQREFSRKGNEAKQEQADEHVQNWLAIGLLLRKQHPNASDRWLADRIAVRSGDKASTIRAALQPEMPLAVLRREPQKNG